MKTMTSKRLLAALLSAALLFSFCGAFSASATTYTDTRQPLTLAQVPFTDVTMESERASDDAVLLEIYQAVKTQTPTLCEDGKKIILPATGNDNYAVSLYGSSNKAVIDLDGNVTQPLEDLQVYLYYKVTNLSTGENLHMDDPLIVEVNGLYEDTQCSLNRPAIMPGIQEWKGNDGTFTFSGNLVLADESLQEAAEVTRDYIRGMTELSVTVKVGTPAAGDIYLAWDESLPVGKEGYALEIDDVLTVTAPACTGMVYAGATLSQMLMDGNVLPKGLMRDYPQYEVRAAMLDVARFYMPMDYLREVSMYAAFFKINELHAHINDNNGEQNYAFRVESKKYPEINGSLPADEVYSQEEYKQYQEDMKRYGLDVITEIDSPAHARFVAAHDPSLMLDDSMIDIRNPEAVAFIKSVLDEFLDGEDPVIRSTKFHVGLDEYDYSYADEIRNYTNEISAYVAAKGYEPRVWCSIAKTESSSVAIENLAVQHVYLYSAANMQTLLDGEFPMINNSSKYLYVVPITDDRVADFMDVEMCYNRWEAGHFSTPTSANKKELQPGHPLLRGSESAIWYDDKVGCSEFDYFNRFRDHVMIISEKNWFGKNRETSTYEAFTARVEKYSNITPLANPGRYIASQDNVIASYDFTRSASDLSGNGYDAALNGLSVSAQGLALDQSGYVTLPFRSAGYPYSVDVTLQVTDAPENAALFEGRDGTLFLNYDGTGKLGLERKGYRFLFDYEIPTGVKLTLRLVCKDEKTYLYVEDALIGEAQLYKTSVEVEGITSFVLPTERIGGGITGNLYALRICRDQQTFQRTGTQATDKSALQAALAQTMDLQPYSLATVTAYEQARQMAQTVCDDPGADAAKVAWALEQLESAQESLSLIHRLPLDRSVCPHCGKTDRQITWKPWPYAGGAYVTESGHYYLDSDLKITSQIRIGSGSSDTRETAADVVLDLNGHQLVSASRRCLYVFPYSHLSVLDSVGTGVISGGSTDKGATLYMEKNSTVDLWNVALTAGSQTADCGGVVHIAGGALTMHSGMLYGGSALASGGNIYLRGGATFTLKGGTVAGGAAETGAATSSGGNIYATGDSTVNIEDGLVIGGAATEVGGNIGIDGSALNITGGTIRDGYAVSGGNIGASGTSTFFMSGGCITGGNAKNYGGNFRMNKSAASFTMTGGVIDGDISINATMKLEGSPVINLGNSTGMHLIGTKLLNISQLSADARIYVARTSAGVFTTGYDPAVHARCFLGAVRTAVSVDAAGQLRADNGTTGYCPHCGQLVEWTGCTVESGQYITQSGHFYLTAGNTGITSMIRIGQNYADDNSVVIDLNGKKLEASRKVRIFYVNTELSLLDSAGRGEVSGASQDIGATIYTGTNTRLQINSGSYITQSGNYTRNGGIMATNGEVAIHGGIFDASGVVTTGNGGVINAARGILTVHGGYFRGGTATVGGTVHFTADAGKTFHLYGGLITGGTATDKGGNISVNNEAVLNIHGGVITRGTGDTGNNNADYNYDNVYLDSERRMDMSGGLILAADGDGNGNGILAWTRSFITLGGDATVCNGTRSGNVYVASTAALTVKADFRGTAYIRLQAKHLPAPVYGMALTGGGTVKDTAQGSYSGRLYLEGSYGYPRIFGSDYGALTVAGAAVVSGSGLGWYENADAALQQSQGGIVRLYAAESTVKTPCTHTVDLNGRLLTVAGGQVFCIDSANRDYRTYGKAVAAGGQIENVFATTVDGETYCMLPESEGYSFHKLDMQLTGVSLRPSTAGIYYNGTWQLDAALKSKVKSYGIAVSLTDMPTAEFDADTLWTELSPDTLESGKNQTSVIIENILRQDAGDNDARGKQKIYAAAYIVLDDGTETGHRVVTHTAAAYSLCDVLMLLDENAYADNQAALEDFYSTWSDPLSTWGFANIGKN